MHFREETKRFSCLRSDLPINFLASRFTVRELSVTREKCKIHVGWCPTGPQAVQRCADIWQLGRAVPWQAYICAHARTTYVRTLGLLMCKRLVQCFNSVNFNPSLIAGCEQISAPESDQHHTKLRDLDDHQLAALSTACMQVTRPDYALCSERAGETLQEHPRWEVCCMVGGTSLGLENISSAEKFGRLTVLYNAGTE